MKQKILILTLLVFVLLVSACATPISEIKNEKYIDETVTVKGTVQSSMKLGDFSGYVLQDESGDIFISSNNLPSEGEQQRVSGTLKQVPIINTYYIENK